MITLSTALPIHFWASGIATFNEGKPGFVLPRPYYHELLDADTQKLQISDTVNNVYYLFFTDDKDKVITTLLMVQTAPAAGIYSNDVEFSFLGLGTPISDQ